MGKYEKWASIKGRFLAMTSLSQADFDRLLPFFACAHDEAFVALANNLENKNLLHDATEREVPCPQDAERQKEL